MVKWIGYMAAITTTSCYIPQALHIIYTRKTAGISLIAYSMLALGVALWMVYGLFLDSGPLIISNAITLALVLTILVLKIRLG